MKLSEIELDLPYQKNEAFICKVLEEKAVGYEDAVKLDYELHWKEKRREFQLMTRCMTSMLERIMQPVPTENCRKILIECVENSPKSGYSNLLGVYVIQTEINLESFYLADDHKKKEMVIATVLKGMKQLSESVPFSLSSITDACAEIISAGYKNEWIWKRIKVNKKNVAIQIEHEVKEVHIFMVITSGKDVVSKEKIVTTAPDEWEYSRFLGKLIRISENEAALIDRSGNEVMRSFLD